MLKKMSDIDQNLIEQKNQALKYLKEAKEDINPDINDEDIEKIYDICTEVTFGAAKNIQTSLDGLFKDEN